PPAAYRRAPGDGPRWAARARSARGGRATGAWARFSTRLRILRRSWMNPTIDYMHIHAYCRFEPEEDMDDLTRVFSAVADYFSLLSEPMRIRILHSICQQEKTVTQIVAETG